MWHFRGKKQSHVDLRQRLIRETELALYIGLRFPERVPRIPFVKIGTGSFDPQVAEEYWENMLGDLSDLFRFTKRNPHVMETE